MATTYRVTWQAATVHGTNGSQGVFYQGDIVRAWETADGTDAADQAELDRLVALGAITADHG